LTKFGACLVFLVMCAAACFVPAGPLQGADYINYRSGLPFCARKLAKGEKTRLSFFGGAITAGKGAGKQSRAYPELLTRHFRKVFPKGHVAPYPAAVGGTGSWLGAFRVANDVGFRHKALVFVEFAVDDADVEADRAYASLEGIVRQLRSRSPETDIVFLYAFASDQMQSFRKGKLPDCIRLYEKVAKHYDIPSVNMARFIADKIIAGKLSADEFTKDGVHPTDKGHALYLEVLKPLVERCKAEVKKNIPPTRRPAMPKPISARPMEKGRCVPYEWCDLEGKWQTGQKPPAGRFRHVLASDNPGDTLTLKFKGVSVGYYGVIGPDSGDFEFSIDGGEWKRKSNFVSNAQNTYRAHATLLARDLPGNVGRTLKLRIAPNRPKGSLGRFTRIGFILVEGEAMRPPKISDPLKKIDAIYASMKPVRYIPKPGRWKLLGRSMKRLENGPSLRIVMLGDSIINDTGSSMFELLLERAYPKCKVKKIRSVRGSTGCWWYKKENRVKKYVLDHKPDLLMIGGISQHDDVESIREVIKQVRAKSNPEIMVMTKVFGSLSDKDAKGFTREIDAGGSGYHARLKRMAQEEKVEFLDMTRPWSQYLRESGKAYGWFRRDPVHANDRGKQILGRILEKYFSPK